MADQKDKKPTLQVLVFAAYKWFLYVSSSLLLLVSVLYILGQLATKQPIDYSAVLVFVIPFSCVFAFILFKRFRKIHSQS